MILYDYLKRLIEVGTRGMNGEVIKLVREEHPKYVLWVAFGEYYEIQESTFDVIREGGTRVVGWFFDDDMRFDYYSKWWAPHIDYFVTNDIESVPKYRELGAWATRAICTGPTVARDWRNVREKYEISFIGSLRADRQQYIQQLQDNKLPIHLFGAGWGKFVSYEEMLDIFGDSKINLNFSKNFNNMKLVVKARIFEVCLAGGFLLTEYFPGIEDYFEVDKEIVCFRNPQEMIEKITYYLSHEGERRAIAQAGWERATSEYTSYHMVAKVFDQNGCVVSYQNKSYANHEHYDLVINQNDRSCLDEIQRCLGYGHVYANGMGGFRLKIGDHMCQKRFIDGVLPHSTVKRSKLEEAKTFIDGKTWSHDKPLRRQHIGSGEIAVKYAQGTSTRELARMYGVSQPAIHARLKRFGTPMRPLGTNQYSPKGAHL